MPVRIAIIGDFDPAKESHRELDGARRLLGPDIETSWVATDSPHMAEIASGSAAYDGFWIAPGRPYVDHEAVRAVIRYARETGLPLLATCGGLQAAVIEFVRTVLGEPGTHAETDGLAPDNAVAPLACSLIEEQRPVTPVPGTAFAALVGGQPFMGMHSCGYAPTEHTIAQLLEHGWVIEASAPDAPVEVLTYTPHPFFVLTLFQPHAGAIRWGRVHPIIHAFVDQARRVAPVRAAALARRAQAAAERIPRPYVHQMRGPRYRWWRPLLTLVLFLVLLVVAAIPLTVPFYLAGALPDSETFDLTPGITLWINLLLATSIPVGLLATRLGHWRPAGRLLSVTGRVRWGWLGLSLVLVLPLWIAYLALSWVVEGQQITARPAAWGALLVVTLLTTPLQAAGEEIAFRGVLVQAVGAWFANRWVALAVSTACSFALFAAAHGSMDPWIWLDLGSLALAGCWLTWRTGGLEASTAIHVVNNLTIIGSGLLLGGLEDSYVSTDTTGSPLAAAMSLAVMAIATWILTYAAQRRGIAPPGAVVPAEG